VHPWQSFTEHDTLPTFEVGYHLLNWLVKWAGGTYSVVLLLASLFMVYALYRLLAELQVNRFYVLTMYASYSYLILQFAQVRQSIAIAFLLLSCRNYMRERKQGKALGIAALGVFFQYSTLIYLATFFLAMRWPKRLKSIALWGLPILGVLFVLRDRIDFFGLLSTVAFLEFAQTKLTIYEATQETQGSGVLLLAGYLLLLGGYVITYIQRVDEQHQFLAKFALVATFVTLVTIVIFPDSYVMFSRAYVMASLMLAVAISLILAKSKGTMHTIVFAMSMGFAVIYCYRLLSFYEDEYLPYQTILDATFRHML
jgi:hypothetical protein